MTTVYFVRHAEPNYDNHDDAARELSPKGLKDRELVTAYLADRRIDRVMSSPFKRAVDTVGHFANLQGLSVETVEDFRERRVGNGWIEDFDGFCKRQWEDFSYRLSEGESLAVVQERNIRALFDVLRQYPNQNIVVGSHGTALSAIVNYFDPSFGYAEFQRIQSLMPWVVKFVFEGENLLEMQSINLFERDMRRE